jgi:hypothetical protein
VPKKMLQACEFEQQGKDCHEAKEGCTKEAKGWAGSNMDQGMNFISTTSHLLCRNNQRKRTSKNKR